MKLNRYTRSRWGALLLLALFAVPGAFFLQGCTDLGEDTFGVITPDNFYQNEDEVLSALVPVYAQLRTSTDAYFNLSQVSSDETVVPTRGSDWYDNGKWLALDGHDWNPNQPPDLNTAWVQSYTGVARANGLLETLQEAEVPNKDRILAEIRTLRAFYYYQLLDLFGNVPLIGDDEFALDPDNLPANATRAELFNFIEQELTESRTALPEQWDAANHGRVTRYTADAILASLYLNAEVWTGTVSQSGMQRGQARWQDAINAVDRILNAPHFALEQNWFDNFDADNTSSPEHLFVVQHLADASVGLNFPMRALHYNQLDFSPWNGFSTLVEVYNQFEDEDQRRGIFLAGQAHNFETGEPATDRNGDPLVFGEIGDVTDATEGEGIRINKFAPDPNYFEGNHGNDYPFFRLAEMYLIKAEALNELNGPTQGVYDLINTVRERVVPADLLLDADMIDSDSEIGDGNGTVSKEEMRLRILRERLQELTYESKRRQDQIRITTPDGTPIFLNAWKFKQSKTSEPYRVLFPIPQPQRDANPNLAQNPGYY